MPVDSDDFDFPILDELICEAIHFPTNPSCEPGNFETNSVTRMLDEFLHNCGDNPILDDEDTGSKGD